MTGYSFNIVLEQGIFLDARKFATGSGFGTPSGTPSGPFARGGDSHMHWSRTLPLRRSSRVALDLDHSLRMQITGKTMCNDNTNVSLPDSTLSFSRPAVHLCLTSLFLSSSMENKQKETR